MRAGSARDPRSSGGQGLPVREVPPGGIPEVHGKHVIIRHLPVLTAYIDSATTC
jgi:hypothetical protein